MSNKLINPIFSVNTNIASLQGDSILTCTTHLPACGFARQVGKHERRVEPKRAQTSITLNVHRGGNLAPSSLETNSSRDFFIVRIHLDPYSPLGRTNAFHKVDQQVEQLGKYFKLCNLKSNHSFPSHSPSDFSFRDCFTSPLVPFLWANSAFSYQPLVLFC